MTKQTQYPTKFKQSSGSDIVDFHNLINVKNNNVKSYALTGKIGKKTEKKDTPATVSSYEYKFKIPSNALVKKVTVKYYHTVRGADKKGDISDDKKTIPHIPAPTISLSHTSLSAKKGKAPAFAGKAQSVSWTGKWSPAAFNNTNFGAKIQYGKNTSSKQDGYLRIHYICIVIEYTIPAYSLQANTSNTSNVYNHDEYGLKIKVSDKNLTGKGATSVLIVAPSGFTLKKWKGNVVKVQNLVYRWTPSKLSKNSADNELIFDTDVSFPTGQSKYTFPFTVTIEGTSIGQTVNALIYKEKPKSGEDIDPDSEQEFNDDTTEYQEVRKVIVGEEFEYTFEIPENKLNELLHTVYDYGKDLEWWSGTYEEEYENIIKGVIKFSSGDTYLSKNSLLQSKTGSTWSSLEKETPFSSFVNDSFTLTLKGVDAGYDEIYLKAYARNPGGTQWDFISSFSYTWRFLIRPEESSLSIPNFVKLDLTEEELHRLGDGYAYTAQTNMKLYGYSEYYTDNTTNSLTYVSSTTHITTKADGGPAPRPDQFVYEFDFKTTSTDARVFIANESLENKTPQNFPRNSISMGTIDGKLTAHMAGDTDVEVIEGDTATLDTYYHMKLEYDGTELSCYIDGTLLGTFSNCKWIQTLSDIYFSLFIQEAGTVTCKDRIMWWGEGETYVRDWYKNFRIGVFNNPIYENQHKYLQYDNEDTEFDGYFFVPGKYDIDDATLNITVDAPITLYINETEYDVTTTETIDMFEVYNVPVTFTRVSTDNVIIELELYDANNQRVWESEYHINFNAEETKPIQEITEDSTDYVNLTDEQIFQNADYWADNVAGLNEYKSVECQFTYEQDYPLHILVTGDYPEGDQENSTLRFNEPCIIESDDYQERRPNGNYPIPIDSLVLTDDVGQITLDQNNTSETIVFYDLPFDEGYGTGETMAIRGIEVTGNVEQSDQIVLYCKLKSPDGMSRERSVVIDDYETTLDAENNFHLGGNGDLWGFSTLDLVNLEQWEMELIIANTLESNEASISFNSLQITFYVTEVDQQKVTCRINGEDTAYYGVFLTKLKIPEGLETDTEYLKVDGTDTNDAYRQNIKEKVIEIEFDIGEGCSLETSTLSLRDFAKLLVNDRDEYNRPIPKTIEFSHYPDVYWEYIMEEPFDNTIDINTYECKVKLTVPAGTSYDKLTVKPVEDTITIRENVSGQEFHMGYSNWDNRIIEIDCEDRIVWLKKDEDDDDPININKYVDFNSNWFTLKGEYAFEGIGCIVRTVDYQERWS